jgi:tRNA threonylcarbamoyl adenosine modification protein (Sua5/YciO/YrdC/YwlC family)
VPKEIIMFCSHRSWLRYTPLSKKAFKKTVVILPPTPLSIWICGNLLRAGFNVAFPTETVYGLGGNIFDEEAILRIYRTKGRPSTNPVIVHVPNVDSVYTHNLTRMTPNEQLMFEALVGHFSPGPITWVVRANTKVVSEQIRNGSEFVGVRIPKDPIALALLTSADVPIAAPSANLSGKVSPTTPEHVLNDYEGREIFMPILGDNPEERGECVGLESTIAKIKETAHKDGGSTIVITILRAGAIGAEQIKKFLVTLGAKGTFGDTLPQWTIEIYVRSVNEESSDAPGQLLTHYSPKTLTRIAKKSAVCVFHGDKKGAVLVASAAMIVKHGYQYACAFQLADTVEGCANQLYDVMRTADIHAQHHNLTAILICVDDICQCASTEGSGLCAALKDKVFRASSGKKPVQI